MKFFFHLISCGFIKAVFSALATRGRRESSSREVQASLLTAKMALKMLALWFAKSANDALYALRLRLLVITLYKYWRTLSSSQKWLAGTPEHGSPKIYSGFNLSNEWSCGISQCGKESILRRRFPWIRLSCHDSGKRRF